MCLLDRRPLDLRLGIFQSLKSVGTMYSCDGFPTTRNPRNHRDLIQAFRNFVYRFEWMDPYTYRLLLQLIGQTSTLTLIEVIRYYQEEVHNHANYRNRHGNPESHSVKFLVLGDALSENLVYRRFYRTLLDAKDEHGAQIFTRENILPMMKRLVGSLCACSIQVDIIRVAGEDTWHQRFFYRYYLLRLYDCVMYVMDPSREDRFSRFGMNEINLITNIIGGISSRPPKLVLLDLNTNVNIMDLVCHVHNFTNDFFERPPREFPMLNPWLIWRLRRRGRRYSNLLRILKWVIRDIVEGRASVIMRICSGPSASAMS